jgi:flavin prenyltransferase
MVSAFATRICARRRSSAWDDWSVRIPWVVGVSGASGTPYAAAVLRALAEGDHPIDLIVSRAARLTLLDEARQPFRDGHWRDDLSAWVGVEMERADIAYWPAGDLAAGPSSGSYLTAGMIVVPASTAACAGIAIGLSKDLLQRAAEVNLKERRPVVVVPRETPVSRSHLTHLIALLDAGAVVLPASPGFYAAGASASAAQLIDFVAGKALDAAGVKHSLFERWNGELGTVNSAPRLPAADNVASRGRPDR